MFSMHQVLLDNQVEPYIRRCPTGRLGRTLVKDPASSHSSCVWLINKSYPQPLTLIISVQTARVQYH